MAAEAIEPIERWTAKRRMALVVSTLKGEASVAEAARTHGLTVAEVEDWREKFLLGAENALRTQNNCLVIKPPRLLYSTGCLCLAYSLLFQMFKMT
ncbi:MAG: transposase [Nitrospira sp.]|jgi:transposase-like protein|nr:transposase [Nitrospira sp.]